jgi:hypothetical protein
VCFYVGWKNKNVIYGGFLIFSMENIVQKITLQYLKEI